MPVVHRPSDFLASIAKLGDDEETPRPLSLRAVPARVWRKILQPYQHEPTLSDAVRAWLEDSVLPSQVGPASGAPTLPGLHVRFETADDLLQWLTSIVEEITPQQTAFLLTTLQYRLVQRAQQKA